MSEFLLFSHIEKSVFSDNKEKSKLYVFVSVIFYEEILSGEEFELCTKISGDF